MTGLALAACSSASKEGETQSADSSDSSAITSKIDSALMNDESANNPMPEEEQDDAPEGAVAKFQTAKGEIFLMPNGKISSTNANVRGRWKKRSDVCATPPVWEVYIMDKRYDGEILYLITQDLAYDVAQGSQGPYIASYNPKTKKVKIECEYEEDEITESGENDWTDLRSIKPSSVKWYKK